MLLAFSLGSVNSDTGPSPSRHGTAQTIPVPPASPTNYCHIIIIFHRCHLRLLSSSSPANSRFPRRGEGGAVGGKQGAAGGTTQSNASKEGTTILLTLALAPVHYFMFHDWYWRLAVRPPILADTHSLCSNPDQTCAPAPIPSIHLRPSSFPADILDFRGAGAGVACMAGAAHGTTQSKEGCNYNPTYSGSGTFDWNEYCVCVCYLQSWIVI